jgi:hypothetical protein
MGAETLVVVLLAIVGMRRHEQKNIREELRDWLVAGYG